MEQTTTACFVALIGMCVAADALVGAPGDCLRQPDFSPGAWRTSAVTPGRLEALVAAMRQQLVARGRQDAPSQRARIGEETGRLWICLAARLAETGADPRGAARYVNLTRLAAESACLNAIRLVPLRRAGDALREKEQLPLADIDAIAPGIELIRAPHPDDESLGCGGFIATARARPPLVIVVTDGTGSHPGSRAYPPERLRAVREAEVPAAVAILGLPPASVRFLRLQDTRAPHAGLDFDRAVHRVAALAREHGVATICTTWRHDPHCEHSATHRIGATVADITGHQSRKRRAIAAHASEGSDLIADDPNGFRPRPVAQGRIVSAMPPGARPTVRAETATRTSGA